MFLSAWENLLIAIPPINALASNLHRLELASNRITDVAGVWRENNTVYEQLAYLGLRHNNITSIDAEVMGALPQIAILDLRDNSIIHFEDLTVYSWRSIENVIIHLGENPLDCGPDLSWVASARQVGRHAICATPTCKAGFALSIMSE